MSGKPQTVTLWWCEECWQHDRLSKLVAGHFANGYRCDGELRQLTYTLDGAA